MGYSRRQSSLSQARAATKKVICQRTENLVDADQWPVTGVVWAIDCLMTRRDETTWQRSLPVAGVGSCGMRERP
jgi:hypothetical protein